MTYLISVWVGKRGALEIFSSIPSSLADAELKKTHITYKSNLDSRLACKYINTLMELNLVSKSKKDQSFYTITSKGRDFLKQYDGLMRMIEFHV